MHGQQNLKKQEVYCFLYASPWRDKIAYSYTLYESRYESNASFFYNVTPDIVSCFIRRTATLSSASSTVGAPVSQV